MQNPSMSSQEQPEDQSADDQTESAEPETAGPDQAAEATDEHVDGNAEDQRLEELGEHIDKARAHAEDAGVIEDLDEQEYVDSGATPAQDDQTITPPG